MAFIRFTAKAGEKDVEQKKKCSHRPWRHRSYTNKCTHAKPALHTSTCIGISRGGRALPDKASPSTRGPSTHLVDDGELRVALEGDAFEHRDGPDDQRKVRRDAEGELESDVGEVGRKLLCALQGKGAESGPMRHTGHGFGNACPIWTKRPPLVAASCRAAYASIQKLRARRKAPRTTQLGKLRDDASPTPSFFICFPTTLFWQNAALRFYKLRGVWRPGVCRLAMWRAGVSWWDGEGGVGSGSGLG